MTLGKIIKKFRETNLLSMQEFADRSNLSKGYISMLEKGFQPGQEDKKIEPSITTIVKVANAMGLTTDELVAMLDGEQLITLYDPFVKKTDKKSVKIPVYGYIRAGIPVEAITDILDYEEIPQDMAVRGEFFALRVKGDSMSPELREGDVVIIKSQNDIETGEMAIVIVNGEDATIKRIVKTNSGLTLIPSNSIYAPLVFTKEEVEKLPVMILGKVVELRRKF